MKRIDFIKRLLGITLLPITPVSISAAEKDEEYKHDEIFCIPYPNNHLKYFNPESPIYKMIEDSLKGRILDAKKFAYYSPQHNFILIKKETYTKKDFEPLIALLNGRYEKYRCYAKYGYGETIMRMIYDESNNSYYPDLFDANTSI